MIISLLRLLKPSPGSIRELALHETDPAHAGDFDAITLGPVLNGVILAGIAVAGAVVAIPRLALRLLGKR
jgi:hypothetical protein